MDEYSEQAKRKIQLYFAANYLYARGKSHPQVVEMLSEFEKDRNFIVDVADAAMYDKWRLIFNEIQRLISLEYNYDQVINVVSSMESDREILHFIYNLWYNIQAIYAEHTIESPTNIFEGIQGFIICSTGLAAMICFDASLFSKIIWSIGAVAALITWIYGLHQKKLAREIRVILEKDYTKFNKLI